MADAQPVPIAIKPGINRTSTEAGIGLGWYEGHLVRWVSGRLRPILGWEKASLPEPFPLSPIRALHVWLDQAGQERLGILCEQHLYTLTASELVERTPAGGIEGPGSTVLPGGYGGEAYGIKEYGTFREPVPNLRSVGHSYTLTNWGEDLLAMTSADGRLIRWQAEFDSIAEPITAVTPAGYHPIGRTFVVTPERHVMIFGLDGKTNKFGWCSQEDITDWDFTSLTNSAGFYEIEPASTILSAIVTRYATIFWTPQGAYVTTYKALPYIYSYEFLGAFAGPLAPNAAVAYGSNVIWPASDGFWMFDGSSIRQVACPILDWFQQTYDISNARFRLAGWFNGAASEVWWSFPSFGQPENDTLIIYNFEERWWSMGRLGRSCGYPGTMTSSPVMATVDAVYRHERGLVYGDDLPQDPERPEGYPMLPWIRSGAINITKGTSMATVRQLLVDTDAPRDAVEYQLFATKGRYTDAAERVGPSKLPRIDGKIDYRISGRDIFLKMKSARDGVTWSFGEGQVLVAARGRKMATSQS